MSRGFSLVGAFGVIDADERKRSRRYMLAFHSHRQLVGLNCGSLISARNFDVANLAIHRVDESGANQAIERARVAIHLGLRSTGAPLQQLGLLRVVFGLCAARAPAKGQLTKGSSL